MIEDSIDINKLCCNPVVLKKMGKTSKTCYFWAQFLGPTKKGFSMDHAHNEKQIVLAEITKADYQLSKLLVLSKYHMFRLIY